MNSEYRRGTGQQFPPSFRGCFKDIPRRHGAHSAHAHAGHTTHSTHADHTYRFHGWRQVLPSAARMVVAGCGRCIVVMQAAQNIDRWTLIHSIVKGQFHLDRLAQFVGNPDVLASTNQAGQTGHHVFFNVAVEKEISANSHATGIFRRIPLKLLESVRKPYGGRNLSIGDKCFQRTHSVYIGCASRRKRQRPANRMGVKVVPDTGDIQVEYIPA
nr:hypothetical protein [Nitrosospira sp. Nsp18]